MPSLIKRISAIKCISFKNRNKFLEKNLKSFSDFRKWFLKKCLSQIKEKMHFSSGCNLKNINKIIKVKNTKGRCKFKQLFKMAVDFNEWMNEWMIRDYKWFIKCLSGPLWKQASNTQSHGCLIRAESLKQVQSRWGAEEGREGAEQAALRPSVITSTLVSN